MTKHNPQAGGDKGQEKPILPLASESFKDYVGRIVTPQPDSWAATCRWVKASERLPEVGWEGFFIYNDPDDGKMNCVGKYFGEAHSVWNGFVSHRSNFRLPSSAIEWLEEDLPPSKPQAGQVTVGALGEETEAEEDARILAEAYCNANGYKSDKEQYTTTPWTEWNIRNEAFRAGFLAASRPNAVPVSDGVEFLDAIRDYEKESGNKICYDERSSEELYKEFKSKQ